jgi:type II secretory pathway component HofQ
MEQETTGRSVEQADGLSDQELDAQQAAALPDREAMSTVGLDLTGIDNFAMPINEAIAINNQSVNSVAVADADQTVIIGQVDTEADS